MINKILVCVKQRALVVLPMLLLFFSLAAVAQVSPRQLILMEEKWKSVASDTDIHAYDGFENPVFNDKKWKTVSVPHTWDQYEGYRRLLAGNRHGYAWYRKSFTLSGNRKNKKFFLFFEGVGSYATVYLNGKAVGTHAGGRTTFTLDVTHAILQGNQRNVIAVRADHPKNITDLPWVDGGASTERGFSEGSQPMGIFRPVSLLVTNTVKVAPFGVHIWNDAHISEASAIIKLGTELKNYQDKPVQLKLYSRLLDTTGQPVSVLKSSVNLKGGETKEIFQQMELLKPQLWSVANPYLYTVSTRIMLGDQLIDECNTPYGIRSVSWPLGKTDGQKQFLLNGKPVFINGIAEYEHLIGNSHAFSDAQIRSRVMQIRAAGFNAFRDAHQPHNLRYQEYWDKLGMLSWTQMAAHIWYDTPEFRKNFKTLLREWVKERRNSPSVVLWGLENESTLPEDFAMECAAIIREMDPTASTQRKITTCNGGKGTDWDVPQNWTGTYGGDPLDYGKDLERQVLVGEYGAWRTLDLHTEGPFVQQGLNSEDRMAQLMETKIRLAEAAKDKTAGHFFWLFNSHDNPGRVQGGEGLRELDRVGPVNYKGLLTPWEEPLDVYYLFRANYADNKSSPMVYIVSHTWPERWLKPGIKDSISVYSNCDEVELFNDINGKSLGKINNKGKGTHFQWDKADIRYNVLYAVGYVNGKPVAKDYIVLNYLPKAPHFSDFFEKAQPVLPAPGYTYLYRVNAGGPDYVDQQGNTWMADRPQSDSKNWGSVSWAADFPGTPALFASQRRTFDPIRGTTDWPLFQSFRYGRDKLRFAFPVPDGEYLVELYFTEPWLGTGGGADCEGWRLFDVAVNDKVYIRDLDIWKESGHDGALKKTIVAQVRGGMLTVSFPQVKAGQALLSAVAIATKTSGITPARGSSSLVNAVVLNSIPTGNSLNTWMDKGADFSMLPPELFGAEWLRSPAGNGLKSLSFTLTDDVVVYVAPESSDTVAADWLKGFEDTGTFLRTAEGLSCRVYRKRFTKGERIDLNAGSHQLPRITAAFLPPSSLAPAFDLKSAVNYPAVQQFERSSGTIKQLLMGKERLTFSKEEGFIDFQIKVGVADTYSLTLKYHHQGDRTIKAGISVVALDGTVMKKKEEAELTPSKTGKWSYFSTNTGTMINAGTYLIRIKVTDAKGLSIDGLEVQ